MTEELNLQAMQALAKANEVRVQRAADKRKIRLKQLDPLTILEQPPRHWHNAKVIELLLAMPYVGRRRAGNWLSMANVSSSKRLIDMTPGMRHRLTGYVRYGTR
jgi:hypothetical protein